MRLAICHEVSWKRSLTAVGTGVAIVAGILAVVSPIATKAFGLENFESFNFGYVMTNLGYTVVATMLAGYVTAWIAGDREIRHAAVLAKFLFALAILGVVRHGQTHPGWAELILGGCGPVSALFGAAVRRTQRKLPVTFDETP